jgi:imidazolonepropionase-like amidohydrolase
LPLNKFGSRSMSPRNGRSGDRRRDERKENMLGKGIAHLISNKIAVIALGAALSLCSVFILAAAESPSPQPTGFRKNILLVADRIFDGVEFHSGQAIRIEGDAVAGIGPREELEGGKLDVIDLGDATILPGFIELHAHVAFRNIPLDAILRHGVTTVRDLGGPLLRTSGGDGKLRLLTAGPIITVEKGYPLAVFGKGYIAEAADSAEQGRAIVRRLVEGGAALVKVAIEPGGETGAPWSAGHHNGSNPPWPTATLEIVSAIVSEAHRLGKIVSAHLGENGGASLALAAGVDEWAHVPCAELEQSSIERAAKQRVKVVTTLDTLSHCPGAFSNARRLAKAGVQLLYGAEIAHLDIPWGIDAQELHLLQHAAGLSDVETLRAATSEAGKVLGMSPLGILSPGAPADLIAVKGDPRNNLKILEYPQLVMSGGRIVVDNFASARPSAEVPIGH